MDKPFPHFSYKPGRTVEELEEERLRYVLSLTHEQRFRRMMQLIRASQKMKEATIIVKKKD